MKRLLCGLLFFAFFLYGSPAWALALTSGSSVSADLTVIGEEVIYSFSATAGQGVILSASSPAYIVSMVVKNPDGTVNSTGSRAAITSLPTTGTYSVVIKAASAAIGTFTLYYVRGGDSVSNGTLKSGTTATGSLPLLGLISYKLSADALQGFSLANSAAYIANIRVFAPDGSTWTWGTTRLMLDLAPTTGDYTVVIYGANAGDAGEFKLYYVGGAKNVSNGYLVNTKAHPGNFSAGSIASYKFTGSAGNSLAISSTGSFIRYLYVYKPDGTFWKNSSGAVSGTLPSTGTYNVAVFGNTAAVGGAYSVTVTTPPPPPPATTPTKSPFGGGSSSQPPICLSPPSSTPNTPPNTPRPPPSNIAGNPRVNIPNIFAGNPINFDVGYKGQIETDYDAAGLSFSRIYRSDSNWTANTVGTFWRHNYARTLTVTASAASMIDGSGTVTNYTLVGSDWVPNDPSTLATFKTISGGYQYTLPDNTVEKYNSTKQLTRIEYLGGGALNLVYNGSGQLTTVTNENGRQLTLTYASGRVATLVTPDGTYSYTYGANTNLTTVTRPDTEFRTYHYENLTFLNALTGITDENGVRFATYTYNASGKSTITEHAGTTDKFTVAYNVNDTSTVTNPLAKNTDYTYVNLQGVRRIIQVDGVASTNCPASSRYYNYDDLGRVIGRTDWQDNMTLYEYDARGNVTKLTEAAGTPLERITTTTYDPIFNLPNLVTEPRKTTDYDYDTYGRMTTMTVTDRATSVTRITTYAYYANTTVSGNLVLGRLSQVDGPRTDVSDITSYAYDANLNLTSITNPLSQVTQITARDAAGRATTIVDPNNVTTKLTYDTNGWLKTATQAFGTGLAALTTFTYDFDGNLKQVTLPNGVDVYYTYDNAQRLTDVTDDMGNKITYTLNAAGDVTKREIRNATPTLVYTHDQNFDELSRMIRSIGAASQTATFGYDKNSNQTSYIDPKTNPTTTSYDALQRVATVTNALSGVATSGYNAADDLTSMKDQRNNITSYTYNGFGDVTGEVSPDRGTIAYVVDKAGNVTQMTDARSVVSNYTYDALNRLLTVAYPSNSALNATLTYDTATNCGTPYKGKLCSITDAAGTTAFQYDVLGRVTQQKDTRSTYNLTTNYTYDLAGNVATITLPSGRVVTYTRNANGQVSGVSAIVAGSSVNLATSVTYLPFGPLKSMTYGNTRTFTATFDQDYYPLTRAVSTIYSNTYVTDANGNVTQSGATTYGYDALNRINAENPGTAAGYTYDATDNRLTKVVGTTTTTTVPAANNKISAVGANAYTYDAAGNITADGINTYTWSAAAQLATVNTTGGVYTYNMNNQRAKKVAGGVTTYYIYGTDGLLYGEYSSTGTLVKEYVYLNGEPLAQITAGSPETLIYLHPDHLGTPRYATNTAGASVWAWTADAFGTSTPTGTATVNLRMPGQYFDSESGLFYNWNRYYNPRIGRYISSDPIGLAGGLNTFGYVGQNPVNWIDLMGLEWQGFMPAHTAPFSVNPIGGSPQAQLEYAGMVNGLRSFEVGLATGVIAAQGAGNLATLANTTQNGLPMVTPKPASSGGACPANGVPEGWLAQAGKKPGNTKWVNPKNPHDYVRIKPDGTVTQVRNGQAFDIKGNSVPLNSPDAHGITLEQFIFRP